MSREQIRETTNPARQRDKASTVREEAMMKSANMTVAEKTKN